MVQFTAALYDEDRCQLMLTVNLIDPLTKQRRIVMVGGVAPADAEAVCKEFASEIVLERVPSRLCQWGERRDPEMPWFTG